MSWWGRCRTKPDRVAHRVDAAVGRLGTSGGRVERGEQRVLDQHARTGQPVEQRGLAGVGVAGDGHRRDLVALALLALGVAGALHVGELAAQLGDLGVDAPPVGLDLRLTGTTPADTAAVGADTATGLAGELATPAAQPLLHVAELGQLDLGLALRRLRVLGEDVEDQRGAVDDLDLEAVLEVPQLAGLELAVADDGVGAGGLHDLLESVDLAAADVRRRVGLVAPLVDRLQHLRAGRSRRAVRARPWSSPRPRPYPPVQTPTRTTRSRRSWRYSTSLMSSSSVDRPATRRRAWRSARSCMPTVSSPRRRRPPGPARRRSRRPTRRHGVEGDLGVGVVEVPAGGLVELGLEGEVAVVFCSLRSSYR